MTVYNETIKIVIDNLERLRLCLASDGDLRKCLALLPSVAFPLKGLMDVTADHDSMFIAYLLVDQLGNVQHVYDGNSDRWYELNEENVNQLRQSLQELSSEIVLPLKNKEKMKVINGIQKFWITFHHLARSLSSTKS